jgi:hypothetical protein
VTAPEDLLRRLDTALDAATTLGLPAADAAAVRDDIAQRSGYPGDLYVLALAGGTGVGKSSLLNALAGSVVSTAGTHRPTTTGAIAWVPEGHESAAAPLLDWLGGADVVVRASSDHGPGAMDTVALLDLPDLDSVAPGHAARVDAVLPRVDAVAWVSDPEKYADAVLHDRYLRRWTPRLGRQAFVLNKTDRVSPSDAESLRADIRERLSTLGDGDMPILLTSAHQDPRELRAWLAEGVEAREVIRRRQRRATDAAIGELLRAAGMDPATEPAPLLSAAQRAAATDATTEAILRVVDIEGLRTQAAEATIDAARGTGGGLLGRLRTLLDRGSGRRERVADAQGHLIRWHDRGSLVPATLPLRKLLSEALADLPAGARSAVAGLTDGDALAARLGDATDRAVAGPAGRFEVPRGRLWPLLGVGQVLATAALIAGVVWLIAAFLTGSALPAGTFDVPVLGPMPMPAVLILVGLFGSWILSRILTWDARHLGRAWADGLASEVRTRVERAVADAIGEPLAAWDDARRRLWVAAGASDPDKGHLSA